MSAVSVGVEWHVSASAEAEGDPRDGSAAHPFGTVSAAAAVAQPGDTITIHAGVYRERVVPPRGGTSDSRRITYQAAPGDRPTITGSERYTSWHPIGHNVWRLHLPNATFGTCNPYAEPVRGDWFEDGGMQHLRGMVLQDGAQLPQAANLTTLFEHARPAWWAQVGSATTEILGWFAVDPNVSAVEVAVRETVFSPAQPHINYLTVRGLDLRNAATNWVSPTEGQEGLLTALWCRGWVIEDNDIAGSRCCGIALAKASDEWDGLRGTTEGYYLTIEDARRYGGWSRDTIGGHIVRNNRIRECGQTGIVGSLGCAFSVIEGNEVSSCNTQNIWGGAEMAGIKLHGAIDTIIRDNHIHHNGTFGGLWLDWMAQGTLITGNVFHDNAGQDIFLEVNHGPVLVATNVLLSPVSYLANTRGAAFAHNLIAGSVSILHDDRCTPVLEPHGTAQVRMQRCVVGDSQWFHNILCGPVDLRAFNADQAERPSAAAGNVYLDAAHPSEWDVDMVAAVSVGAAVLEERTDGWYLTMPTSPEWRGAVPRARVTTATLNPAVVPGQRFTLPNGGDIALDRDLVGAVRPEIGVFPGPIEDPTSTPIRIWPRA